MSIWDKYLKISKLKLENHVKFAIFVLLQDRIVYPIIYPTVHGDNV